MNQNESEQIFLHFYPQQVLITQHPSYWENIQLSLLKKDSFESYLNLGGVARMEIKAVQNLFMHPLVGIIINPITIIQIKRIQFVTISTILSQLGGFYTAIVKSSMFIMAPLLYRAMVKYVSNKIRQKQRIADTDDQIFEKIANDLSFVGLYGLFERVEQADQKLKVMA